jgi:hypothetical protein
MCLPTIRWQQSRLDHAPHFLTSSVSDQEGKSRPSKITLGQLPAAFGAQKLLDWVLLALISKSQSLFKWPDPFNGRAVAINRS